MNKEALILKEIIIQKLSRNEIIHSFTVTRKIFVGTIDRKFKRIIVNIPLEIVQRNCHIGIRICDIQRFNDYSVYDMQPDGAVKIIEHISPQFMNFDKNMTIITIFYSERNNARGPFLPHIIDRKIKL